MEDNNLIQVYVKSISAFQEKQNFRIIELGEVNGNRVMRVVIGTFEADYIASALDNKYFKRPMPYDVISDIIKAYKINLKEIIIFSVKQGVIYSKLILDQDTNIQEITIRISDALAVAVETDAPIFIERKIVDDFFKNLLTSIDSKSHKHVSEMTIEELKEELKRSVDEEDYELAAELRDEISKRNEK
ncbi:MAG: bifunctional nuclease family protein [Prevotellaceae bacterium]|jgi:bifunctional DNase/RNase|nr:bifunctional nuclease family protein [Prevotellaceae bacterium]